MRQKRLLRQSRDYSQLFEKCYQTESKRRSYIESIIERKQPSVGYIVLANLIKYSYLKTIITTNFDSLVSLACSNYTDIFPVIYSLGNFASEMTVSSERPRILKIHGDFLFSKLKNTAEDLDKPDENMERQVRRILEEYDGLIIIGYSGGDNSVMSIFDKIPEGKTIYWCGLSEDSISDRAQKFLQDKKGTFVKIEGFDELMQIIRILIELDNESIVKTFQDRQIEINKKLDEFQDVQLVDEENDEEIKDEETETFVKTLDKSREVTQLMISANQEKTEGKFDLAEKSLRKAIELDPNYAVAYNNLGGLFAIKLNRPEEAESLFRKAIELDPNRYAAYHNLSGLLFDKLNRPEEAIEYLNKLIKLDNSNPSSYLILSSIYKSLENKKELDKNIKIAKSFINDDYYDLACLNSILDKKDEAFKYLKMAVEKDSYQKERAKTSISLKWIRDDPRFKEIVGDE